MYRLARAALLVGIVITSSASAAIVEVDLTTVSNGQTLVFADSFDDGALTPPWTPISGSPGPEAGTVLTMTNNEAILASLSGIDPLLDTFATLTANLVDFPAGSALTLVLLGQEPGDFISLTQTDTAAIVVSDAGLLGLFPLVPSPSPTLTLGATANGAVIGLVDQTVVFAGSDPFRAASGLLITVVPEPATLGLLVLGSAALFRRRRA